MVLLIILKTEFGIDLPQCIIYVDDINFILQLPILIDQIQSIAPEVFAKWGLHMNGSKAKVMHISKGTHDWKTTRKLGSLRDINTDIQKRKNLAQAMSNQCWKLWDKKFKLSLTTKVMF